jgi:hypothetical protein
VNGDIELASEGMLECDMGRVGSCVSVVAGWDLAAGRRGGSSGGMREVVGDRDTGAPGPKDGIAVGVFLVLLG